MKTKWFIIPVIALSLGCTREIETNVTRIDGEFTLYASSGDNETKTVLQQDGRVFWSPEDCIKVFYGNVPGKFTSTNAEPAASAEFTGSLGSITLDGETEFQAVYPFSNDTILGSDNNILSIVLPSEQTAVEGTFADDLFICVAKSKDVNLHFYNVCGGVKFSLARDDIKKVVFKGNNGELLAGRMAVEFNSDGLPLVTDFTAGKTSVTLTAPDGGNFKSESWYYLVLAPQALTKGYTMELWTNELAETISSESSVSVKRSSWGVLKDLASEFLCGFDAIDLGLSVNWASCNLGAIKPEGIGDYYAWGETEPYYISLDPLIWKEGKEAGYGSASYPNSGYSGAANNNYQLERQDDAAHILLGEKWRIPTRDEMEELIEHCTWIWTSLNGMNGYKVKGPNGNSIFLPAAGSWYGVSYRDVGDYGYYWSSSLLSYYTSQSSILYLSSRFKKESAEDRFWGLSIRPVRGFVDSISLDKTDIALSIGESVSLTPHVYPTDARNKDVIWSTSDETVAIVSSLGEVLAVGVGSAIITAMTAEGGEKATCNVTVETSSSFPVAAAVDLGLSVKWASFNMGATNPVKNGYLYSWGETEPKEDNFGWGTYKWCNGSEKTLTKYCTDSNYGYNGFVDGKTVLEPEDDAAHVLFGSKWRIPTKEEQSELQNMCRWVSTKINGVLGYKVTGPNGNSIFLPAAGGGLQDAGNYGRYWSATLKDNPSLAHNIQFRVCESDWLWISDARSYGRSLRPVFGDPALVESVSIDKTELELSIGETAPLVATVFPENTIYKNISWSSSDETVAMISFSGVVTAVSSGTAVITVTTEYGKKTDTCKVIVRESSSSNPIIAIDLGLSVKWASLNLGATRPVAFGDYYAWGETEPYYISLDPLIWKEGKEAGYDWPSYKWCMGTNNTLTKYCIYSGRGYNGFTDGKTVLEAEDDAARVNLGDSWRMPTLDDCKELREKCTWEWRSFNDVAGFLVIGPNGNSIFLPATGAMVNSVFYNIGERGGYWTTSLFLDSQYGSDRAHLISCYYYSSSNWGVTWNDNRYNYRNHGHTIRPVYAE